MVGTREHSQRKNEQGNPPREPRNAEIISKLRALNGSLSTGNRPKKRQPAGEDHKLTAWTRNLTIVTVLLVAVGAIGDALVYYTLADTRETTIQQAKDTQAALKIAGAQAANGVAQASAAQIQADAAKTTAETAQKEMVANSRAWVGPNNALLKAAPALGQKLDVTVQYQNTGREPARDVSWDLRADISPDGPYIAAKIADYTKFCSNSSTGNAVVYPTAGFGGGYELHTSIDGPNIAQAVIDGKDLVFAYGCFSYVTLGEVHHSSFCYFFVNSPEASISNMNICTAGQHAD